MRPKEMYAASKHPINRLMIPSIKNIAAKDPKVAIMQPSPPLDTLDSPVFIFIGLYYFWKIILFKLYYKIVYKSY